MKVLSFVVLFALVTPAFAANYVSLSCSNATGSVMWEEGENANLARLEYDGFVAGVLDIEIEKIAIERKDQVTLRQELLSQCGANSTLTTYAARVVITPAQAYPDALLSYFPRNKIEADVICEQVVSGRTDCHPHP